MRSIRKTKWYAWILRGSAWGSLQMPKNFDGKAATFRWVWRMAASAQRLSPSSAPHAASPKTRRQFIRAGGTSLRMPRFAKSFSYAQAYAARICNVGYPADKTT
jgi:hypothetical protein